MLATGARATIRRYPRESRETATRWARKTRTPALSKKRRAGFRRAPGPEHKTLPRRARTSPPRPRDTRTRRLSPIARTPRPLYKAILADTYSKEACRRTTSETNRTGPDDVSHTLPAR